MTLPSHDIIYSDTPTGAVEYLKADSTLPMDTVTEVEIDPVVHGVWRVWLADGRGVIVWLKGYPDPFGKIRTYNDFEVEE